MMLFLSYIMSVCKAAYKIDKQLIYFHVNNLWTISKIWHQWTLETIKHIG